MKIFFTILTSLVFVQMGFSQITLLDPGHPGVDLSGTLIEVSGLPSDNDVAASIYVYNAGSVDVDLKVRRTEIDVKAGTKNVTCWVVCPSVVDAGTEVVQVSGPSATLAPGDTNKTFYAHCYPENIDGCSLFRYEWIDAANSATVYATIDVRYAHTLTDCAAGVSNQSKISTKVYPNPANDIVNISLTGFKGNATYEVANLLGQRCMVGNANINNEGIITINTSSLKEGIYFVNLKANGKVVKTEKLIVSH